MCRSTRHSILVATAAIPVAFGLACSPAATEPDGVVCTLSAAAGINLTIVDSLTGQPVALTGLWARAREGSYVDSTIAAFTDPQSGAVRMAMVYERRGTYAVTVHANGFQDWNKNGVVVTGDVCHVIGVPLTARMAK